MTNLKTSKQREAILSNLQARCDHPTAEQLYLDLKSQYPALSLATVYRNLKLLEKNGSVKRIVGIEADRLEGSTKQHYHLICNSCGQLIDLQINQNQSINSFPLPFGGEIISHDLMYYGICPKCKAKQYKDSIG